MTERRAALLGLAGALVLVVAQLAVASSWSLMHDDPTELELTRRCLEHEKLLAVEETQGEPVAATARGGALSTIVEGGLVTISVATSTAEVDRLLAAYADLGEQGRRVDVYGQYVSHWLRDPSVGQRQTVYDCAY